MNGVEPTKGFVLCTLQKCYFMSGRLRVCCGIRQTTFGASCTNTTAALVTVNVCILFQMSHFSLSESKLGSIPYVEKFYKKHFEHRRILGKMCIKIQFKKILT